MLSCLCDTDYANWYYYGPSDFSTLDTKRRRKCCSCKKPIDVGSIVVELQRFRDPLTDIEEAIEGDSVQIASWYLCEWCGEMYFNFEALGYCYLAGDDLRESLKEYHELSGFKTGGQDAVY